jgi:hypothetical protein
VWRIAWLIIDAFFLGEVNIISTAVGFLVLLPARASRAVAVSVLIAPCTSENAINMPSSDGIAGATRFRRAHHECVQSSSLAHMRQ